MANIKLEKSELKFLKNFIKKGRKSARSLTRARILLLANKGKGDTEIAKTLDVGRSTALRIRNRYLEEGLQSALVDKPRTGQPEKYSEKHKAEIIAQACTQPPEGRKRWSLVLLCEELRKKEGFKTINKEKSFYEAFSEDEAKQILEKIEFHYTPKHASWLNAAEI